jgi:signal transduction histidine kinase
MQRLSFWLLLLLCSCGTRHQWANEQEEAQFWDAHVLHRSYDVMYREKSPEHALQIFDSLLAATHRHSPFITAARYGISANYHYFFTPDNSATGRYIDSALGMYSSPGLQQRYPRAYVGFLLFGGEIAFRLSNYSKANNYYFLAKQSADRYLNPCERSGFTYNVAMVSYRQQDYAQSAAYFKEAYATQATCPAQTTAVILQQQEIQSNIGLCLVQLQQYDSALFHFNKALQISEQHKDSLGAISLDRIRGVVYGNMAKSYAATGKLSLAEELFKKSIALNARPGYELRDAALAQEQLAEVYATQKRFPEMLQELQSVRKGLDTLPDTDAEVAWRRLMFTYYRDTRQPLSELAYFKTYVALRDSIDAQQKQMVLANTTRQLKDKEQELRITVLTKNNQLANIYLWVAVALSGMAAFIIFLIYQNNRRSRRNVRTLTRLNEEVSRQKAALEKANNEKDRILHVVAHDLRSPIGVTAYVAELILMEEREEKDRAALHMISEAAQQALILTNELLGLRPGDADGRTPEKIMLSILIRKSVDMVQHKAAQKGQAVELLSNEILYINGYPERLHRLFGNLLDNAIKFSPLQEGIEVTVCKKDTHAVINITDHGLGIPPAQQSEIFDRFTPARRTGTGGEKSFGLGLSICREIAAEHGGSITLQSREGEGTSFIVSLPLADNT